MIDMFIFVSTGCFVVLFHFSLLFISLFYLFSGEGHPLQRTESLETAANYVRTGREGEGTRAPKTRWLRVQ